MLEKENPSLMSHDVDLPNRKKLVMRPIINWNVPYISPIRDKFPPRFENAVLGRLKSSFQLDHQS